MIYETRKLNNGKYHNFSFYTKEEMEHLELWMLDVMTIIQWSHQCDDDELTRTIIDYYFEPLLKEIKKCIWDGKFCRYYSEYSDDGITLVYELMLKYYPFLKDSMNMGLL